MVKDVRTEKKQSQAVLRGYKRVRKRFVPPLLQLPGITETNYVNECLPQVVWMCLLNRAFGLAEGTDLALDLAQRAHAVHTPEDGSFLNFALCESYGALTAEEASKLKGDLADSGRLHKYQEALAPLLGLRPTCPMRLTGLFTESEQDAWVGKLGEAVLSIYDKRTTEASTLCANIVVVRGLTGGMFFPEDFEVPNFKALITSPESEEAQFAASFARAASMNEMMAGGKRHDSPWCVEFWNRNATIDDCLFLVHDDEEPDDAEPE